MIRLIASAALVSLCAFQTSGCTSSNASVGNSVGSAIGGNMANQGGATGFFGTMISNAGTITSELNSTPEAEQDRAAQMLKELRQNGLIVENHPLAARMSRITRRMVATSGAEVPSFPFEVYLTRQPEVNAYTTGGGIIFINQGLLALAENEAQLVGVVAHETAHILLKHGAKKRAANILTRMGITAAQKMIPGLTTVHVTPTAASSVALTVTVNAFGRDQETEADSRGVELMIGAGYDPRQMVRMFETMEETKGAEASLDNFFFADHPTDADRIKVAREKIKSLSPDLAKLKKDTKEFRLMIAGFRPRRTA